MSVYIYILLCVCGTVGGGDGECDVGAAACAGQGADLPAERAAQCLGRQVSIVLYIFVLWFVYLHHLFVQTVIICHIDQHHTSFFSI